MKKMHLILFFLATLIIPLAGQSQNNENEFTFVFMTDIHVQPEKNAVEGFRAAINKVNELDPDFVITGGDLIMDALGQAYGRADSLYNLYNQIIKEFKMPHHNTIGNHEIYGWYSKSGASPENPEYGKNMFEKRIGPRYHSFEHNGWLFLILDSVEKDGKGGYQGGVDSVQMAWISELLSQTDKDTPIALSVHIPMLTTEAQVLGGATVANEPNEVITNSKEVRELFKEHNLKLVLQGHLHFYETMCVFGTNYITGGAVSGAWWEGPYLGTEEGFIVVHINGQELDWKYVDYGWEVK
jgi:3',5'-cyclic AMP phosphodiesterase CpdA